MIKCFFTLALKISIIRRINSLPNIRQATKIIDQHIPKMLLPSFLVTQMLFSSFNIIVL